MNFGFEVYDRKKRLIFSSEDATWNLLFVASAPANTSRTITNVPYMPERIVMRHMVGQVSGDDEAYVHSYSLSGNTLTITAPDTSNTVETMFMVLGR